MKTVVKLILFIAVPFCILLSAIQLGHGEQALEPSGKTILIAQAAPLPPPPMVKVEGIQGRISLDLRNIDVVDALKFLSMKAGLNIVTTKTVTGRTTLMVEDSPIQDVFDIMLRSNNLAYDKHGDIYNVMSQEEYKALYGKSFSDVRQVKVFYLKYIIPEQAFSLLDMLKSDIGRVLVDPESGNVLVLDAPARIAIMEQALKDFEEKNTVKVFKLNYAKAKDVEEALKSQLDLKRVGSVKADERGNQVVVQTLPDRMDQIEKLIGELDQKTKEIIVDVNIVNIKLSDDTSEGIQWEGLFNLGKRLGYTYLGTYPFSAVQAANDPYRTRQQVLDAVRSTGSYASYPFTGTTSNLSAGKQSIGAQEMHLGVIGKQDIDVIFKYLQTIGKTKILSNPKIAVVNNQEAKIHVGQKEAYVTTTTTTGQTNNTVSEQVTFVDVGIIISVVPFINDDGFVTLKIKVEVNSVLDTLITPTNNKIPIIDTSLAETTVLVKEGSTVIIGGLKKEQTTESVQQTPVLGQLPILGHLFRVKTKTKDKSEMLVILTPRLITGEKLVSGVELKEVGGTAIKPIKPYAGLKGEDYKETAAAVLGPVEGQKLELKGMKAPLR
jgi:type II secretory pathway component GspD/PulD (secretin)